jgi:hypothetical protein
MSRFRKLGVSTAASVVLLAGGGYAIAASGDGAGDAASSAAAGAPAPLVDRVKPMSSPGVRRAPLPAPFDPKQAAQERDKFYAALGDKLGKSGDEVKAAFRSLLEDHLSADVKAGRLTEQQKEAILKGFDAGLPGPGMGMGIGPGEDGGPPPPIALRGRAFHGRALPPMPPMPEATPGR